MKNKERQTAMVKHQKTVKNKVAKLVIGTKYNIGSFYDEAAVEYMKIFVLAGKK